MIIKWQLIYCGPVHSSSSLSFPGAPKALRHGTFTAKSLWDPESSIYCFRQYSSRNFGQRHQGLHHGVRMCACTQKQIVNLLHSLEASAPSVSVVLPAMTSINNKNVFKWCEADLIVIGFSGKNVWFFICTLKTTITNFGIGSWKQ